MILMLCSVLMVVYSFPLGIAFIITVTTALWFLKRCNKTLSNVEFYKLHDIPESTEQALALVSSEWPSPLNAEGTDVEPNYVRTSSMQESSDSLPCHLVAVRSTDGGGRKQVVAHVVLRESPSSSPDMTRFFKMLKAGLPVGAVKQAMQIAGVDPSALTDPGEFERSARPPNKELRNVTVASLVVKPEFRGRGLGRGLCAFAVHVASNLDLGVKEAVGYCKNELVPFYEKLGVKKRVAKTRLGIPKVRLGNEMFVKLDTVPRNQIKELLALVKAGTHS